LPTMLLIGRRVEFAKTAAESQQIVIAESLVTHQQNRMAMPSILDRDEILRAQGPEIDISDLGAHRRGEPCDCHGHRFDLRLNCHNRNAVLVERANAMQERSHSQAATNMLRWRMDLLALWRLATKCFLQTHFAGAKLSVFYRCSGPPCDAPLLCIGRHYET